MPPLEALAFVIVFQFLNSFKKRLDTNTQSFDVVNDFFNFRLHESKKFFGFKSGE